jgi:dGTPase
VVSWADRIAYVCHDFEDAVSAGIISADALPRTVTEACGTTRSSWIQHFIAGVVEGTSIAGHIAMTEHMAEALSAFRCTNYERIYLRPESIRQGRDVVTVLQALVEHFADHPHLLPGGGETPDGAVAPLHRAVGYVAGMTDRFACVTAVRELDWDPATLPRGLDSRFGL